MRDFPLDIGNTSYKLEFDQFTSMNVEDMGKSSEKEQTLQSAINDVRAVSQENKKYTNIGPSVVYRIRDKAGQAVEYKNYMLPVKQEQDYFFITGTRTGLEQQYRWLRIPADKTFKPDTFMAMRELLKDEAARKAVIRNATLNAPDNIREQFTLAAENTLGIFAKGGYLALDDLSPKTSPKRSRKKCRDIFTKCCSAS